VPCFAPAGEIRPSSRRRRCSRAYSRTTALQSAQRHPRLYADRLGLPCATTTLPIFGSGEVRVREHRERCHLHVREQLLEHALNSGKSFLNGQGFHVKERAGTIIHVGSRFRVSLGSTMPRAVPSSAGARSCPAEGIGVFVQTQGLRESRRLVPYRPATVGRRLDVEQLVGAEQIAEKLGLKRYQHVHELRRRNPDFPAPVLALKHATIWYWPDVEKWAKATGRLTR
jgi:hypothetical protein